MGIKRFTGNRQLNVLAIVVLMATLLLQGCSGSGDNAKSNGEGNAKGETMSTDVVVVGSGATGMSASIQAKQLGLDVIMLEKNGSLGGSSNSAEGYGGINTNFAKKQGIHYDVKKVFKEAQDFHHWATNPELLMKYYQSSGETGNWLESLGVKFDMLAPNGTNKFNTWHLYHRDQPTTNSLVASLSDNAKKLGVKIMLETRGKELIMKDGKVAGIKAEKSDGGTLSIKAPVVILATGGYANNPKMIEKYAKIDGDVVVDVGVPGRTGDGINMALKVGASDKRLKGTLMNFGAAMKGQPTYGPINMVGWMPLLKVNQEGFRFEDESVVERDWGTAGNAQKQQGYVYHIVTKDTLDGFIKNGFPTWTNKMPNFYDDLNKALEKNKDSVFKADTLEELADKMKIDKANLEATVNKWNEFAKTGVDKDFGLPAKYLYPVEKGPYYGFKFGLGIFATTDGLEVTPDAQVLDKKGKVIPGLYAGGGDAGGLNGETYDVNIVPGSQQGWAVNSGRFAAKDAKRYIGEIN